MPGETHVSIMNRSTSRRCFRCIPDSVLSLGSLLPQRSRGPGACSRSHTHLSSASWIEESPQTEGTEGKENRGDVEAEDDETENPTPEPATADAQGRDLGYDRQDQAEHGKSAD